MIEMVLLILLVATILTGFPVGVGGAMKAKYWMTFFVFSVFPAPDSPLHEVRIADHVWIFERLIKKFWPLHGGCLSSKL